MQYTENSAMPADVGVIRKCRYYDVEMLEIENESYSREDFIKILTQKKDKKFDNASEESILI